MITKVIPPGESLIEEVLGHLRGTGKDYSRSLVVFPGKRPSHFLRKAIAAEVGSSFIPPAAHSMDEFIDALCEELGARLKLEAIDAVAILYEIHKKAARPLGGKGFMNPDSFFSLGLKIYRDLEELTIEGVSSRSVKEIESFFEEGLPEQTKGRLQSLACFYEEFYKKTDALGFSTRSGRYQLAAAKIDEARLEKHEHVILAGFFALTKAEKMLFQKLMAHDNVVLLFQEGPGLREQLKDLAITYHGPEKPSRQPELHFYSSPDTHGQVLALGKALEQGLEADAALDEKTVIVLPSSETLFPLVRQGLSSLREDTYNVSMGYPLHRTPVFGFLNNLMELSASTEGDRIYIPDYLKFVLHPYTKNIYYKGKSESTRILFHSVEENLLNRKAKTFTSLAEIEEDVLSGDMARRLTGEEREHLKAIHRETIGRFFSFANIGDFARKCTEVLFYISNNSTAKLHPLFYPFSESLVSSLDLLMRSLIKDMAFYDKLSYFIFFRKYAISCHTPFSGTPVKGLQVLGSLETRNLKFDRVFVVDANEEILPDTRKEETLLPFKARQILGLPTYLDRDRLAAYHFDALLQGAKEVHLFFREDDKSERSRFVEKLLWEKQKHDKTTDVKPYIRPVQYEVSLANGMPGPIPKTAEVAAFLKDLSYNPTVLNRYLRCPLQFYYATVLQFSGKEEITGDIARDDLGSFIHSVLRSYFSGRMGRHLRESDIDVSQMDQIIEDRFDEEYGKGPSGSLYLLKRQIKKHMAAVLRNYYVPLVRKKAVTIVSIEDQIDVVVDSFKLSGRLDSIERRDDKTVIVDFKTGSNQNYLRINMEKLDPDGRETWAGAIGSLQLPFYLLLYSEKERIPAEELDALFLLLGRSNVNETAELPLFDGSSAAEVYAALKAVIFGLLKEVTDPRIAFKASDDSKKACPKCDFQYLCGTQWIVK
ncbi:MAG: PD-(D/E)XK nuclease family protein [Dissulfurispiraceae bacterium]